MTANSVPQPFVPGAVFGRWTLIERIAPGKWLCECSCADKTQKIANQQDIKSGKSASCGCLRKELLSAKQTIHGLSKNKEWRNELARAWRAKNVDHVKQRSKRYREKASAKEKAAIRQHRYGQENKEKIRAHKRVYRAENKENIAALGAERRALKKRAVVAWDKELTKARFKELKAEALRLEKETGVKYHIDHIVPLCGMINGVQVVCGLHVHNNFQLLTASENCSKGPREWPNMP